MARKKYYQSEKDREDEREGMERYWDEHPHRRKARESRFMDEGGMIHEDRSEPANLPQKVVRKKYKDVYYGAKDYDHVYDSIRGVDEQIDDDVMEMRRHLSKEKY